MKKLKQFSIIFFLTTFFVFCIEYFLKVIQLRIPHKIFHHTLAPNKVFFQHWGEIKYKICTDNNGFKMKCGGILY